ncbi:uncharacterized protein DEA37_0011816, partial [Paragonimus westermani]
LRVCSSSDIKRHLVGHRRNLTAHLAHFVVAVGFKCSSCSAEFGTQIGLSQHRRRVRSVEYNDEKLSCKPLSTYNWSTLEDAMLKNMANEIVTPCGAKKLYGKLQSMLKNRSSKAIKKGLQHLSWDPSSQSMISAGRLHADAHLYTPLTAPPTSEAIRSPLSSQLKHSSVSFHDNERVTDIVIISLNEKHHHTHLVKLMSSITN